MPLTSGTECLVDMPPINATAAGCKPNSELIQQQYVGHRIALWREIEERHELATATFNDPSDVRSRAPKVFSVPYGGKIS